MSDSLPTPAEQAKTFRDLRAAHAREMAEDYVELIADLIAEHGEARAVDLSERFGVTPATVTNTLKRLERDGFVVTRPYRSIFLTDEGVELAETCKARHRTVRDFLIALGVPPALAETDAEGIEHHVSEETLAAFEAFTNTRG
jgi:DtxR family manganese transport transcriptional regulator